jgi:cytochrome c-type protein NapB
MVEHSLKERRGEDRRAVSADRRHEGSGIRSTTILAFGVVCAAISGYFIGVRSPMNPPRESTETIEPEHSSLPKREVVPSAAYHEMPGIRIALKKKRQTASSELKQMTTARGVRGPGIHATLETPSLSATIDRAAKRESIVKRQILRAYDGAPPTIPHGISQMSSQACMACHEQGIRTSTLRAAKMSHPYYANCTQCHVEQSDRPSSIPEVENSFVGLETAAGSRAFTSAPPLVPHKLWMRNDCLGCHGRTAAAGLQTTHPWRTNCLQCHAAPSGSNVDAATIESPFLPPPTIEVNDEF